MNNLHCSCTFDGVACDIGEDFLPIITDAGMCYVFNANGGKISTKPGIYTSTPFY